MVINSLIASVFNLLLTFNGWIPVPLSRNHKTRGIYLPEIWQQKKYQSHPML